MTYFKPGDRVTFTPDALGPTDAHEWMIGYPGTIIRIDPPTMNHPRARVVFDPMRRDDPRWPSLNIPADQMVATPEPNTYCTRDGWNILARYLAHIDTTPTLTDKW